MIKLPKEVISGLVEELSILITKKDNYLSAEEIEKIKSDNRQIKLEIAEKENLIKVLSEKVDMLKNGLIDIPNEEENDKRIKDLTNMLLLSGYYKMETREDGEYLVETGAYNEDITIEEETQ